jgi:hypothetical protein
MYSYADRLRAVELYLKLGKRIKALGVCIRKGIDADSDEAAPSFRDD